MTAARDFNRRPIPMSSPRVRSTVFGFMGFAVLWMHAGFAFGKPIALSGARIIDGSGRPPIENGVLVVEGDRLVAVGAVGEIPVPKDAEVVDLHGRTVIPGLISAHSHLGLVNGASTAAPKNYTLENVSRQLVQYESYGVTAVMSLGCNSDALYGWRDEQRKGRLGGADIFTADRGLGVTGGAPPFPLPTQVYRPANPDEARADVREMAARHPDLLKLWLDDLFGKAPKMEPEIYQTAVAEAHAAIDEAHRSGYRMAAHVFYLGDAKALLAAGIDVIAHSVRDLPVDEEFITAMKARHVPYIATLALDESQFIYADHPAWMDSPFFIAAVAPELLATWRSPEYAQKMRANPATPKNKAAFAMALQNLRALHAAGVTLSFGTDSGAMPTRLAGFGEHRELQLLVGAGLTPLEAIVCATRNAAETIGDADRRGTLVVGKRADFIVLAANPLDDIHNTTKIEAVWHGGRKIPPIVPGTASASPEAPKAK
jgi:imidazolonepropionase-like amidohydrolase